MEVELLATRSMFESQREQMVSRLVAKHSHEIVQPEDSKPLRCLAKLMLSELLVAG